MTAPKRKVTSKDVAERAGVSPTTVSFVLNNKPNANISEETRQRVRQAARELAYVPDMAARALARGRSSNIALVTSKPHQQLFIDEFMPQILTGLNQVMSTQGFRVIVEQIEDNARADIYTDLIRGKEVAGLILLLREPLETELELIGSFIETDRFPMVSLDQYHPQMASVTIDSREGTRQAVNHLIGLGHRHIACIAFATINVLEVEKRMSVYRATLEAAGLPYNEMVVRYGEFDPETGYEAMCALLALDQPPTAVFAMNDVMAFGAITAVHRHGLRVPEDVAIVGYDDIRLAAFANPALTTVHAPDIERGRQAGQSLLKLIKGQKLRTQHISLKTHLEIRDSCGYRLRHEKLKGDM